jgi:hypothetical protein
MGKSNHEALNAIIVIIASTIVILASAVILVPFLVKAYVWYWSFFI